MHIRRLPSTKPAWLHPLAWVAVLVWAVLLVIGLATVGPQPAAAQDSPPTGTTSSVPPRSPDDAWAGQRGESGKLMDQIVPDPCARYDAGKCPAVPGYRRPFCEAYDGGVCPPSSHYDIGYEPGGFKVGGFFGPKVPSPIRVILGTFTDMVFGFARWWVQVAGFVLTEALTLGFVNVMAKNAVAIAQTWQRQLNQGLPGVGGWSLGTLFLSIAALYMGWHIYRGRTTKGVGEFALSAFIAAVAFTTVFKPAGFINRSLHETASLSAAIVYMTNNPGQSAPPPQEAAGVGEPAGGAPAQDPLRDVAYARSYEPLVVQLSGGLFDAFVGHPHQLINWGKVLGPASSASAGSDPECWNVYRELVKDGPWETDDEPRNRMKDCPNGQALDDFNNKPSVDRLIGAFLVLMAAMVVCVLVLLVACTLVAAQFGLLGVIIVAPPAFLAAILPSAGREFLWKWVTATARLLVSIIAMACFLALFLSFVKSFLSATAGYPLIFQMGGLNLLVILAFGMRRKMLRGSQNLANNWGKRMMAAPIGGMKPEPMPPPLMMGAGLSAAGAGTAAMLNNSFRGPRALSRATRQFGGQAVRTSAIQGVASQLGPAFAARAGNSAMLARLAARIRSDRDAKTDFAAVDADAVLARLARLPVESWRYHEEDDDVRHIGPMAQDFAAAFGTGDADTHIHVVDAFGVALAAIQALHRQVQDQATCIAGLKAQLASGSDDTAGGPRVGPPADSGAPTSIPA